MKRTKIVLLFAVLLFAYSCKKDQQSATTPGENDANLVELSPEEIASIAYDNPKELSEEDVLGIVKDFPLEKGPGVKGGAADRSFNIRGKYYLDEEGKMTPADKVVKTKGTTESFLPVYDVSVTNGAHAGKAFVCADERIPGVVAYIPDNTISTEKFTKWNVMYQYALNTMLDRIDYYDHLKDSLRLQTLKKLEEKLGKLPDEDVFATVKHNIRVKGSIATKSPVLYTLPTRVINQVGPYTRVRWEQDGEAGEYNQKMPDIVCNGNTQRAPAGCGVVAAAQILAHFEPPMAVTKDDGSALIINWPFLKERETVSYWMDPASKIEMIGYLMKHVFYGCSASPNCDGSGTFTANAENYLRQFINIDGSGNFNVANCKTSLDNQRLVMASGSRSTGTEKVAHAWVVDGYAICQKGPVNGNNGSNDIVNRYDMYLHCNMGYGARDNFWTDGGQSGWFLVGNNWSVTFELWLNSGSPRHYNIDLKCSLNARKK